MLTFFESILVEESDVFRPHKRSAEVQVVGLIDGKLAGVLDCLHAGLVDELAAEGVSDIEYLKEL